MGVKTWNLIKRSKRFYIRTYRGSVTATVISVIFNVLLGIGIFYVYYIRPEPDYYATYGETPPVPLIAMDEPNYSSHPLLADDSNQDSDVRTVLQ
ncbi:MAG TPA: type IVB secretion system protein IcmM/DotJ [Legionellaceae bacterium]|nr:type IVB secretion system protein IcmM/DotJ [Legionellaceae bacterium]